MTTSARPPLVIDGIELRLVRLPLVTPFAISTGTMHEKVFPILILRSGDLTGLGEGVMDPLPDYLDETIDGAMALLRQTILPGLSGRLIEHPQAVAASLASWRGHSMTKALVEMAVWDLWAKWLDLPLKTVLSGTGDAVDVGVSLGIGPIADTLARIADHHGQGYKRIKLKIKPGHDIALLEAVRQAFPSIHLTVDANSAYSLADSALFAKMDRFDLDYIEQPLAWDDIHDHAVLQSRINTPICLDESIRNAADARKALASGAARVINIKAGRVGGLGESVKIHDLCAAFGVPVWCGGMLESGIGRAHNIHLSTLANFTRPGDTSSASRYFHHDIIVERLETQDGRMPVPRGPGIGVHLDMERLDKMSQSVDRFDP